MKRKFFITQQKLEQIEKIHKGFRNSPCKTLRDEFLMGEWSNEKKKNILEDTVKYQAMKEYMASGESGNYKQFGVYTKIECMYIYKRGDYLPIIERDHPGLLDAPHPTVGSLIDVSLICRHFPSVLLPIKAFVLKENLEAEYTGIQPATKPVRRGMARLFGVIDDYWDHMLMCNRLAEEWGVTPTHVNTFFWLLGYAD